MTESKDNYTVQYFVTRNSWGVTFECGPQSQVKLFQDFPWLRLIRDSFEAGRPLAAAVHRCEPNFGITGIWLNELTAKLTRLISRHSAVEASGGSRPTT